MQRVFYWYETLYFYKIFLIHFMSHRCTWKYVWSKMYDYVLIHRSLYKWKACLLFSPNNCKRLSMSAIWITLYARRPLPHAWYFFIQRKHCNITIQTKERMWEDWTWRINERKIVRARSAPLNIMLLVQHYWKNKMCEEEKKREREIEKKERQFIALHVIRYGTVIVIR